MVLRGRFEVRWLRAWDLHFARRRGVLEGVRVWGWEVQVGPVYLGGLGEWG